MGPCETCDSGWSSPALEVLKELRSRRPVHAAMSEEGTRRDQTGTADGPDMARTDDLGDGSEDSIVSIRGALISM